MNYPPIPLDSLNEEQRRAVLHPEGPVLVLAGAGSGKTRVLTYRIAYLLSHHQIPPYRILALTFTNKAADEMKERIRHLLQLPSLSGLHMGTFHSIFARILRNHAHLLGYTADYSIYDQEDSKRLMTTLLNELQIPNDKIKPQSALYFISRAKNLFLAPEHILTTYGASLDEPELMAQLYQAYQKRLFKANAMDFDDLLFNTLKLLLERPKLREHYQNHFLHILVDEFQDTNKLQAEIIRLLTNEKQNVFVVGDDSQSIYRFRGALIENILHFPKQFHNVTIYKLERNYRSTQVIVDAANALIEHNHSRHPKKVYSVNERGTPIEVLVGYDEENEAFKIVDKIKEIRYRYHIPYREIAVLYRMNYLSRVLEKALVTARIPYFIYGGVTFYQRQEVKDALAYVRLTLNPNDEEAFRRVVNLPSRGIGEKTIQTIYKTMQLYELTLWDVLTNVEQIPELNRVEKSLASFRDLIASFQTQARLLRADEFIAYVIEKSGLLSHYEDEPERIQNLEELVNAATQFVNKKMDSSEETEEESTGIHAFLQEASLLTNLDLTPDKDAVQLMTIHAAKGLEFECVFIMALENGIFPHAEALLDQEEMEEERRLMYVAMTRAKRFLFFSRAENRISRRRDQSQAPSLFISEVPDHFYQLPKRQSHSSQPELNETTIAQMRSHVLGQLLNPASSDKLILTSEHVFPGMEVLHPKFGKGKVLVIDGEGEKAILKVHFELYGEKTLVLKFAKLRALN